MGSPKITILPLILLHLALGLAQMTGNTVITNLNTISLVYEDLTVQALLLSTPQDRANLVDTYQNITSTEQADEDAPQPQTAFAAAVQYGVTAASHSVVAEERRFLAALVYRVGMFSSKQRSTLADVLQAQIKVIRRFDADASVFSPAVLDILKADDDILVASLRAAITAFGG